MAAVARNEPARIRANAATTDTDSGSSRNVTPAATATAGLTYVNTTALVGPASRISSRKTTNASAVQMTPRPARESRVGVSGSASGRDTAAAGA
ncbi:hypothetical protein [Streptomyces sp. A1499]|uniref:hypothetical protein n=1 Tax=Streptomyces sp. A1499 TaxID=2563104 RepID=UPI001F106244|nr:hypothetical protein [Streptomyces sp. A1499]